MGQIYTIGGWIGGGSKAERRVRVFRTVIDKYYNATGELDKAKIH